MFIDSHCHIFSEYYDDIDKVISDAKGNGVVKYINNATSKDNCLEVIELSKKYEGLYYSLGIHPEAVNETWDNLEELIKEHINDSKFVAIGEIGLDYHYGKETRDKQIALFEYQLSLAEKYNLPVIVHSREATQDTLDLIKKYKVRGVLHCFSGSIEIAREYMKLGFYFGVNGVVTFKNANLKDVIKEIPIENIILETDAPYLTPEPFRKYQNEPKYIPEIARFLGALYEIPLDEISEKTNKNIANLFGI